MDDAFDLDYHKLSADCARATVLVSRNDHKAALLEMGKEWWELADAADRAKGLTVRNMSRRHVVIDPDRWRIRAGEARGIAEELSDPAAKRVLLEIADGYDNQSRAAYKGWLIATARAARHAGRTHSDRRRSGSAAQAPRPRTNGARARG